MSDHQRNGKDVKLSRDGLRLRPIEPPDYELIYRSEHDSLASSWRLNGVVPSFESYRLLLWEGVYSQYLVVDAQSPSQPTALLTAHSFDQLNGHCQLAITFLEGNEPWSMVAWQGFILFIEVLLRTAPLRKMYFSLSGVFGRDADDFLRRASFELEGTLIDHRRRKGLLWNESIWALARDAFKPLQPRDR